MNEIRRSPLDSPHKASDAELWCIFFYLRLNKQWSKQSRRRWFETPWRSLWRYCSVVNWSVVESRACMRNCIHSFTLLCDCNNLTMPKSHINTDLTNLWARDVVKLKLLLSHVSWKLPVGNRSRWLQCYRQRLRKLPTICYTPHHYHNLKIRICALRKNICALFTDYTFDLKY